jgi:hypothetical protein
MITRSCGEGQIRLREGPLPFISFEVQDMQTLGVIAGVMSMAIGASLAGGCQSGHASPGFCREVVKGPALDSRVRVLRIDARQKVDRVLIHGAVQRQSHTSYPIQTHVDVTVTGADGKILLRSRTQDIFVSRRVPGKGPDWTGFDVILPGRIPADATIQATCHNGPHKPDTAIGCAALGPRCQKSCRRISVSRRQISWP